MSVICISCRQRHCQHTPTKRASTARSGREAHHLRATPFGCVAGGCTRLLSASAPRRKISEWDIVIVRRGTSFCFQPHCELFQIFRIGHPCRFCGRCLRMGWGRSHKKTCPPFENCRIPPYRRCCASRQHGHSRRIPAARMPPSFHPRRRPPSVVRRRPG